MYTDRQCQVLAYGLQTAQKGAWSGLYDQF